MPSSCISDIFLDRTLAINLFRKQLRIRAHRNKFADLVNLVALARSGKIQSVVCGKYKFDQVNQAFDELKAGKIISTAVSSWRWLRFRLKIGLEDHTDIIKVRMK